MRTLVAIAVLVGSIPLSHETADAGRKRSAKPHSYASQARYRQREQERLECERARYEDPTGRYAGLPCWAREAFGRAENSGQDNR